MDNDHERTTRASLATGAVLLIATVVIANLTSPEFWDQWGVTIASGVTAAATAVLVTVTNANVRITRALARQARQQTAATQAMREHAETQDRILDRQAMLLTLPVIVVISHASDGRVEIKNKADPPALNVELRIITEDAAGHQAGKWSWLDAVMAKGAEHDSTRPRTGTVHAQVRFLDGPGTLYLVERRWLGGGGTDAYRLFRWRGDRWEHLTFENSDRQPLMSSSSLPHR